MWPGHHFGTSRHISLPHIPETPGALLTKHRSQFTPDAVYIIVIKEHDGYDPSVGFFSAMGIVKPVSRLMPSLPRRSGRSGQNEVSPLLIPEHLVPLSTSIYRSGRGFRGPQPCKTRRLVTISTVLLTLVQWLPSGTAGPTMSCFTSLASGRRGNLCGDVGVLTILAPKGSVLLTSLSVFA